MKANIPASRVERKSVMTEGTLRAISIPVITGTASNQGVMLNLASNAAVNSAICCVLFVSCVSPITVKMTRVMRREGTVVIII